LATKCTEDRGVVREIFMEETMDDHRREALLKEYGEVCANFRLLTDIRFKLLTLLPVATAAGAAFAAAAFKGENSVGAFAFSVFGLVATIGLVTYNTRNDQLYDELVGRAASIERSLGLPDGAFANRPYAWLSIPLVGTSWKVDHRTGVATIYIASIAFWIFTLLESLLSTLASLPAPQASQFAPIAALGLAIVATWGAVRLITHQKQRRRNEMRRLAAEAVQKASSTDFDFSRAAENRELIELCVELSDEKYKTIEARAQFYARDSSGYYLPTVPKEQAACHLVALLTHLPPGWLFDCVTNRLLGSVPTRE
jgi:hypothetical protein